MVKLNEIGIIGVSHPNIFVDSKEKQTLEFIDMVIDITYNIDRASIDFKELEIEEDSTDEDLREIFASYMMVYMKGDSYKRIDKLKYSDFGYMIVSDINRDEIGDEQHIPTEIEKEAFKLIKEYVKTETFNKLLEKEFLR